MQARDSFRLLPNTTTIIAVYPPKTSNLLLTITAVKENSASSADKCNFDSLAVCLVKLLSGVFDEIQSLL